MIQHMKHGEAVAYIQAWLEARGQWYVPSYLRTIGPRGQGTLGIHTMEDLREQLEWQVWALSSEVPPWKAAMDTDAVIVTVREHDGNLQVWNQTGQGWAVVKVDPPLGERDERDL